MAGLGELAKADQRIDQRGEGSSDVERWQSPAVVRTPETAWPHDSASVLHRSRAGRCSARSPRPSVPGTDDG